MSTMLLANTDLSILSLERHVVFSRRVFQIANSMLSFLPLYFRHHYP